MKSQSVISIIAFTPSNESIPLLLREKCKLALTKAEKFCDAYLIKKKRKVQSL